MCGLVQLRLRAKAAAAAKEKQPPPGEAHELALKAAETDATKRALATFGNPFGLALYDRELAGVRNRKAIDVAKSPQKEPIAWDLRNDNGEKAQSFEKPGAFAQALKEAMSGAADIEHLFALWEQNVETVRALNRHLKREVQDSDLAHSLVAHLKACAIALAMTPDESDQSPEAEPPHGKPNGQSKNGHPRCKIDKSALPIGEPKRQRSKEHLRYVRRQRCLICGRAPSHAHHIRYAQPRGLALKVSDEFTVPLCAIHHNQNHATGDERKWWERHGIDPLSVARHLWSETHKPPPS